MSVAKRGVGSNFEGSALGLFVGRVVQKHSLASPWPRVVKSGMEIEEWNLVSK